MLKCSGAPTQQYWPTNARVWQDCAAGAKGQQARLGNVGERILDLTWKTSALGDSFKVLDFLNAFPRKGKAITIVTRFSSEPLPCVDISELTIVLPLSIYSDSVATTIPPPASPTVPSPLCPFTSSAPHSHVSEFVSSWHWLITVTIPIFHMNDIIQHLSFSFWLTSLPLIPAKLNQNIFHLFSYQKALLNPTNKNNLPKHPRRQQKGKLKPCQTLAIQLSETQGAWCRHMRTQGGLPSDRFPRQELISKEENG